VRVTDLMKEFPLDRLLTRLDQMHGVLNALYLCRDDVTGNFTCSNEIVVHCIDAACEILDDARAAGTEYLDKKAALAALAEQKGGAK
jgi:hypothetical protein